MDDIIRGVVAILILGGLYYFWHKCQLVSVSRTLLFLGILIWPFGAAIGVFWALKDIFDFRAGKDGGDSGE